MRRLRFVIVGSGWRSLFYVRLAKALPERLKLCAMLCRTQEKARRMAEEFEIPVSISPEECMGMRPDFVVVAVDKASIFQVVSLWAKAGLPVLSETPVSLKEEELREIWRMREEDGARILVAEQYFLYPSLAAGLGLVRQGILGKPDCIALSMAHDYHGVSLIRQFLGIGMEPVRIRGKKYLFPVTETDSRYGPVLGGSVVRRERQRLTLEFDGGKTGFYDFCGAQYHSFIRTRHLNVQGERGELDDTTVRWLKENGEPSCMQMTAREKDGSVEEVWFDGSKIYENPFPGRGLTEDETAIASLLMGMEAFLKEGTEIYPLNEALQDAYVAALMHQAAERPWEEAASADQPWQRNSHGCAQPCE